MSLYPLADLLRNRLLDAPSRPGLLACLARYEVLRLLGTGGMGMVFLARDPAASDNVAIKVLKPEFVRHPQAVHRFLVEARHMQRLSHPNILRVLEVSERTEGPYFVVPFMPRGSVADMIRPGQPLDTATIGALARDIASALAHAHGRGITHRDLKPGNVLLDAGGTACLADFGLGRTVWNDSLVDVRIAQTEGTPAYIAPEVAAGRAGDTRCDIYSFGAMLYEMLTGEPPYGGDSPAAIIRAINEGPPPSVHTRNPNADPRLARIAEWAMARELRDRYATMEDVLADLQRFQKGHEPLGPHGQPPKWRRPAIRTLGVAALLAAILGVAVASLW